MKNVLLAAMLLSILLIGAGCLQSPPPAQNGTNQTVAPAQPPVAPSFTIASPAQGAEMGASEGGTDVSVVLLTSDLIIKPSGGAPKNGEGHFRFTIDSGSPISVFSKSYTVRGVPEGSHTLNIELVNNDNSAYSPAIRKSVSFTLTTTAPVEYVAQSHEVVMKDFSYEPSALTAKAGDTVVFRNTGAYPRSATSTGNFDTGMVSSGSQASVVMNKEGTFQYFSLNYNPMKGTITVVGNSTG